jgi:hypothetical protein
LTDQDDPNESDVHHLTFSGNGGFFWKKTTPKSLKMGFLTMAMMCCLAKNGAEEVIGTIYRIMMMMTMMMMMLTMMILILILILRGNEC